MSASSTLTHGHHVDDAGNLLAYTYVNRRAAEKTAERRTLSTADKTRAVYLSRLVVCEDPPARPLEGALLLLVVLIKASTHQQPDCRDAA